jgi:hypothetical protein
MRKVYVMKGKASGKEENMQEGDLEQSLERMRLECIYL